MKRMLLVFLLFSGVGLWSVPVLAIDLLTGCRISATDVVFGVYDPFYVNDSTGSISLSCGSLITLGSNSISYEVKLSSGGSGSPVLRKMSKVNDKLNYNLYKDSLRQTYWGETKPYTQKGEFNYSGTLGLIVVQTRDFTIYGRIPSGQFVPAGDYGDEITVTVNY